MPSFKDQFFGVEIEMAGITRRNAAEIVAEYFGTSMNYFGGTYEEYHVKDMQNRTWKFVFDSSIPADSREQKTEFVTPICTYEDIQKIQEIVRLLKKSGATTPAGTGIHVHINGAPFDANSIRNLTNIMASKEDLLYDALQVTVDRENRWCKKVDENFLENLYKIKPKSIDKIREIWYDGGDGSREHYHSSRYKGLNLHSLFSKGTLEFRLFNSTLHAGQIRSFITICLAISQQALSQTCASRIKTKTTNPKYTFRTWLLRLGLIGDEFKNVRMHLLKNLEGNIAWKNPESALLQRERLKAEREAKKLERQTASKPVSEPVISN